MAGPRTVIGPVQRFRGLPPGRQRLLQGEAVLVALLVALALVLDGRGGVAAAVALAALGYAVGFTTHLILVLGGWGPRGVRRGRDR